MSENSPSRKGSKKLIWIIILVVIVLAAGTYLYAGWLGYQQAPKQIQVQDLQPPANDSYTISQVQSDQINSLGYPDAFTILFYEEETTSHEIQTVRLETWDYYTLGIGLTFLNGEIVSEDSLKSSDLGSVAPLPYRPEQFSAFMELNQVVAATGIETYIEIPLDVEFLSNGILYYADSVSFGMQDGQLVYLEALALLEE